MWGLAGTLYNVQERDHHLLFCPYILLGKKFHEKESKSPSPTMIHRDSDLCGNKLRVTESCTFEGFEKQENDFRWYTFEKVDC
jgi:hypothetical protein